MNRKKITAWIFLLSTLILLVFTYHLIRLIGSFFEYEPMPVPVNVEIQEVNFKNREKYKLCHICDLTYSEVVPRSTLDNLKMIARVNRYGVSAKSKETQLYGMILRTLRFQNITQKVEKKYGLPSNILLAMIMKETGGSPLTPNSKDDGGIGLCHMQPSVASEFGLKIYENCTKLRSVSHGKKLRQLINKHNSQLHELVSYDDRFHPIKNLDAAGRILAYHMRGDQLEDTPVKTAIKRYAGRYNYKQYYNKVMFFMKHLNDPGVINRLRNRFNQMNKDFKINGNPATFDDYISYFHQQNYNYGLLSYQ